MNAKEEIEYDAVLQSDTEAETWLAPKKSVGLGPFLAGKWDLPTAETVDDDWWSVSVADPSIAGLPKLTTIHYKASDVNRACESLFSTCLPESSEEQQVDDPEEVMKRTRKFAIMNSLALQIEKNKKTLAVLESVSTGRTINRTLTDIVPRCIRQFRFFAPTVYTTSNVYWSNKYPSRIVCVPANASLSVLVEKLAPAVAQKCRVLVILDGSHDFGKEETTVNLALFYLIEKIASWNTIQENLRVDVVYSRKPTSFTFGGDRKTETLDSVLTCKHADTNGHSFCVLIFDSCDIDAASESLVAVLCMSAEQRVRYDILIQETVWPNIMSRLIVRLERLRVGAPLDRTADLGPSTSIAVLRLRDKLLTIPSEIREFYSLGGTFRSFCTAEESVQFVNLQALQVNRDLKLARAKARAADLQFCSAECVGASVWTEDAHLAFKVADLLSADVVWINGFDLYDPSVPVWRSRTKDVDGELQCVSCYLEKGFELAESREPGDSPIRDPRTREVGHFNEAAAEARKAVSSWGATSFEHRLDILSAALLHVDRFFPGADKGDYIIVGLLVSALNKCREHETSLNLPTCKGRAFVKCLPRGLVAIGCVETQAHWQEILVFLVSTAIAYGNAVVVIVPPSERSANDLNVDSFSELLRVAGLPANVVKVVSCRRPFEMKRAIDECKFDAVLDTASIRRIPFASSQIVTEHSFGSLDIERTWAYCREDVRLKLMKPKTIWDTFANMTR